MKTADFLSRCWKVRNLYARSDFSPLLLECSHVSFLEGKKGSQSIGQLVLMEYIFS